MDPKVLDGVMLLWFILAAFAVAFVAIDIRTTPEATVMKWGFVLLTAYTGPFGAFLYVLGCREPLPGLHERYVAVHWRQALGSTMHCVAGDGVGILVGAVIARRYHLAGLEEVALEYVLGFLFGWTVFQALFMRDMAGSYARSLETTFLPEFLSMNYLMAAMVVASAFFAQYFPGAHDPARPAFWFHMSLALLVGFIGAYPINSWLVARHLKHGMMTVRRGPAGPPSVHAGPAMTMSEAPSSHARHSMAAGALPSGTRATSGMTHASSATQTLPPVPAATLAAMTLLSIAVFAAGLFIAHAIGTGQ